MVYKLQNIAVSVLMFLLISNSAAQNINYTVSIKNETEISENVISFDVFIKAQEETFSLSSYQFIFEFNSAKLNGGTASFEYVNGSSTILNTPKASGVSSIDGNLELNAGSGVGNDIIYTDEVKIGSFRIINSSAFSADPLNLEWNFSGINYTALFAESFSEITSEDSHLNSSEQGPLPVELSAFTGSQTGSKIVLKWETKTEINNQGFEIERSDDPEGGSWSKIGYIKGNGNSNVSNKYSFSDENPLNSNVFYYRLKQIDSDGKYEYSSEIKVELAVDKFELLQNYPNPFNPSTTISFSLASEEMVSLQIYNILGQLVSEVINQKMKAGLHKVRFDATGLASGVYIYRLDVQDKYSSVKKMNLIK